MSFDCPMPSTAKYHARREQIEAILTEGHGQQRQASQWEKVDTYWHIGDPRFHAEQLGDFDQRGRLKIRQSSFKLW